ncbi:NRPS [Bacidia gigantensis]|uniref:NRPS n=1 Tax=Bacidia gigantensis TaxID=2732470 RepID=UPI001D039198|nr:NRPS [Bacidia gigantensis]KAG8534418.1 NRPS [Bacidia gigantensis]
MAYVKDRHRGPDVTYTTGSVHLAVIEWGRKRPQDIALRMGSEVLTYERLVERASADSQKLSKQGLRSGHVIAIGIPRSLDLVVTMLAVLMTGAPYCILDERWPATWIEKVLQDIDAVEVLTYAWGSLQVEARIKLQAVTSDSKHLQLTEGLDAPFCIYHTSGTTGRAKAVITTHRGVLRTLLAPRYPTVFPSIVMVCTAALPWDMFTLEVWFPLLHGGTCELISELTPRVFKTPGLTTAWLTAARFNVLVDEDIDCFKNIKELLIGGERLSVSHVRAFLQRHPHISLINGYGPAEANMLATTHLIQLSDCLRADGIPLGQPLPGTEIRLVRRTTDCTVVLAEEGEQGEIAIAGDALAQGYSKTSNKANESFSVSLTLGSEADEACTERLYYLSGDLGIWDIEGNLAFRGRRDFQFKLHGQRVDPLEIEAAIVSTDFVSQCIVSVQSTPKGSSILTAHVVAANGELKVNKKALLEALAKVLPAYQVPRVIVQIAQLPLTATGKVDRSNLTIPSNYSMSDDERPARHPSTNIRISECDSAYLTTVILGHATNLLGCESLSIDDDLLEKGLDSLGAFRLACRTSSGFPDRQILASDIIRHRTAGRFAAAVHAKELKRSKTTFDAKVSRSPVSKEIDEKEWSTPWLQTQWLTGMVAPHRQEACLNVFAYHFNQSSDIERFHVAFEHVVSRHDVLHTTVWYSAEHFGFRSSLISVAKALSFHRTYCHDRVLDPSEIQEHAANTMRRVNLSQGPIITVTANLQADGVVLLIAAHHATLDGHSEAILVEELSAALQNKTRSPAVPFHQPLLNNTSTSEEFPHAWSKRLAALPPLKWASHQQSFHQNTVPEYANIPISMTASRWSEWKHHLHSTLQNPNTDFLLVLHALTKAIHAFIGQPFRIGVTDSGRNDPRFALTLGNYMRRRPGVPRPIIASPTRLAELGGAKLGD